MKKTLPTTPFGKSARRVTRVGLGGEGILRSTGRWKTACDVIQAALSEGIALFDSAPAYEDSERYYGRVWRDHAGEENGVFRCSKSAKRDRSGALRDLEQTLRRMQLERLDLWSIHDLRSMDEIRLLEQKGGALEAFLEARESGVVGHIGVTGHHDPRVLCHAVAHWPVDAVMFPVNPAEALLGGFLDVLLELALDQGIAILGMKVLGGGEYLAPRSGVTPERLIRFALSYPVTSVLVGCATPEHVRCLAACARETRAFSDDDRRMLCNVFRPYARRLAYYRGTF